MCVLGVGLAYKDVRRRNSRHVFPSTRSLPFNCHKKSNETGLVAADNVKRVIKVLCELSVALIGCWEHCERDNKSTFVLKFTRRTHIERRSLCILHSRKPCALVESATHTNKCMMKATGLGTHARTRTPESMNAYTSDHARVRLLSLRNSGKEEKRRITAQLR